MSPPSDSDRSHPADAFPADDGGAIGSTGTDTALSRPVDTGTSVPRSSSADGPSNPSWRFGVYLFPLAPLSLLVAYAAVSLFVFAVETESTGIGVGVFFVTLLAGLFSYLFAIVTAVALVGDAVALRDRPDWNPNPWLAGVLALVHLGGAALTVPYLLSVPGIGYYVFRRRRHVGGDDENGGGDPGDGDRRPDGAANGENGTTSSPSDVPSVDYTLEY